MCAVTGLVGGRFCLLLAGTCVLAYPSTHAGAHAVAQTVSPEKSDKQTIAKSSKTRVVPDRIASAASGQIRSSAEERIDVVGVSPTLGAMIDRNKVPSAVAVLTDKDIIRYGNPDMLQAMSAQLPGVSFDSPAGNPYQPTLYLNGFAASPLQGTPQGVAVYMNGVRFNQSFGDTVNWDLIPDIAISKMEVEGSNPVFGLNALGGSVNMRMKDGFSSHKAEADLSGGTFGQIQANAEYGHQWRDWAIYVGGRVEHQDGWRDLQSTDIQNFYSDLGYRHEDLELHANLLLGNSVLNGPGTAPVELLQRDPAAQFTAPNAISNRFLQFNLRQNYTFNEHTSFQVTEYYSYFQQRVVNGNAANDAPCDSTALAGLLCSDDDTPSTTRGGANIPDFLNGAPYSELDTQTTNTNAFGITLQETDTRRILGMKNHQVLGFSFDGAQTMFSATSSIGGLTSDTREYIGPGVVIDEPGDNAPVGVGITNRSYAGFFSDTLDLTKRLSLTFAGRINAAIVDLADRNRGDLTGNHAYTRFNPSTGITYRFADWAVLYGGYSEANRAPTPAELSCAGPENSCSLANFFVGDPDLKQVVAHTYEAGLRGRIRISRDSAVTYDAGVFRTDANDDIAFINSVTLNRAYFANVGDTRRQGAKLHIGYNDRVWSVYLNYTFTDATYRTGFVESAGSNPNADAGGNLTIRRGDNLPGIPKNRFSGGADVKLNPKISLGVSFLLQGGQYLYGDEANVTPKLPGYFTLDLHGSWQITNHVQFFARIQNAANRRYYTYGTFSPTTGVYLSQAPNASNPRSYSIAAPVGGYGGIRVTF